MGSKLKARAPHADYRRLRPHLDEVVECREGNQEEDRAESQVDESSVSTPNKKRKRDRPKGHKVFGFRAHLLTNPIAVDLFAATQLDTKYLAECDGQGFG